MLYKQSPFDLIKSIFFKAQEKIVMYYWMMMSSVRSLGLEEQLAFKQLPEGMYKSYYGNLCQLANGIYFVTTI